MRKKVYLDRFISTVVVLIALLAMLVLYPIIALYYILAGVDITARFLPKL